MGCKQTHQPLLREHVIFIMLNSKQTSSVLLSETPPLSFKAVLYVNILEKITWNKGSHCLCLQDVQKHEGPMENHFPIATTSDFFSRLSHKSLNRNFMSKDTGARPLESPFQVNFLSLKLQRSPWDWKQGIEGQWSSSWGNPLNLFPRPLTSNSSVSWQQLALVYFFPVTSLESQSCPA